MDKLLLVGFIKEVMYPAWLKKLIMVKKSNNKWQICVDFIDLNKVCLKDNYHFANINQLVDSPVGFEYLSFLDSNFRYHQIPKRQMIRKNNFHNWRENILLQSYTILGLKMLRLFTSGW